MSTIVGIGVGIGFGESFSVGAPPAYIPPPRVGSGVRNLAAMLTSTSRLRLSWDEPADWGDESRNTQARGYRILVSQNGGAFVDEGIEATRLNIQGPFAIGTVVRIGVVPINRNGLSGATTYITTLITRPSRSEWGSGAGDTWTSGSGNPWTT